MWSERDDGWPNVRAALEAEGILAPRPDGRRPKVLAAGVVAAIGLVAIVHASSTPAPDAATPRAGRAAYLTEKGSPATPVVGVTAFVASPDGIARRVRPDERLVLSPRDELLFTATNAEPVEYELRVATSGAAGRPFVLGPPLRLPQGTRDELVGSDVAPALRRAGRAARLHVVLSPRSRAVSDAQALAWVEPQAVLPADVVVITWAQEAP